MKKIIIAICLWALALAPLPSLAADNSIVALQAQVAALQAKLASLTALTKPKVSSLQVVKGPAELKAGKTGHWLLQAKNLKSAADLELQLEWGDKPEMFIARLPATGQVTRPVNVNHKYLKPGVYLLSFTALQVGGVPLVATTSVKVIR